MNLDDEDQSLRHDVNYLRFLLESGLSEEEIKEIAKDKNPKLEVCFSEEACMSQSKTLERGKYLVLIS
jgi:collagenase-like PrtC family protease